MKEGGDSFEMARDRGSSLDCGRPAAGRGPVPVDTGHAAGNGRGSVIAVIYRICAILMVLLVVMLTGAWAEGLQSWGEAWTIAGICTVVAYLMLRGAGDV